MSQTKTAPLMRALQTMWSVAMVVALLMLAGCANQEAQLVGQWKGDASKITLPTGNTPQEKMGAQMAQAMLSNMTLDLKKDKTFAMNMMFQMEGTWKIENDTVLLDATKVMGMDVDKLPNAQKNRQPLVLTIGSGNKMLTVQTPGASKESASKGQLVFVKQ